MKWLAAMFCGAIFGWGLILGGMVQPEKITGFLNLTQAWDPSLGLVMVGALVVGIPGFAWMKKRHHSFLGKEVQLPHSTTIDKRLLGGSLAFGLGWGLVGYCPGPAWVAAAVGIRQAIVFALFMGVGMLLFAWLSRRG